MNRLFNLFMALAFIGFGIILVLGNLGIGEIGSNSIWSYAFPLFFLGMGLTMIIGYIMKYAEGWMLGSFFFILGLLLFLGQLPTIDFSFTFKDIFKLWPLLIVYIGFSLIDFGRRRRRRVKVYQNGKGNYKKWAKNWSGFTIGNESFSEPNWHVKPINISNAVGDHYFDFTKAFIPDEEIPITVNSLAGDVRMAIPEDLDFRVEAYVKAGEINILGQSAEGINRSLFFETPNYKEATKKLDIYLDVKAGSIRVDQI